MFPNARASAALSLGGSGGDGGFGKRNDRNSCARSTQGSMESRQGVREHHSKILRRDRELPDGHPKRKRMSRRREISMAGEQRKKKIQIVVVGGGAGGLELVRQLGARYGRRQHDIILVDRNRTHIWKPLLHEVAAGSLDANLDEVGYREHCARWGYRYFHGTFEGVDRKRREVLIAPLKDDDGSVLIEQHRIRYDYLVMAVGSVTNDFGTPGAQQHCMMLDSRHDADRFRNRLLNHCLRVSRAMAADPDRPQQVRIAIIGAGATGVELAAELYNAAAGLGFYGLEVFDETSLKVELIEAAPRILPALRDRLAESATHELEKLGVTVRANTRVSAIESNAVVTASGERIAADI